MANFVKKLVLISAGVVLSNQDSLPAFSVSDTELKNLINVMNIHDVNRARPNQLRVNYQRRTTTRATNDAAPQNLLPRVDPQLLRKPTYQKFIDLLDNYIKQTGVAERYSQAEMREIDIFLSTIAQTAVMGDLYWFLHNKRHPYARTTTVFKQHLKQLWFQPYSRARGVKDTSGFEHTFLGEICGKCGNLEKGRQRGSVQAKRGEVGGLHNWIRVHLLERQPSSHFDYKGYIVKRFNTLAVIRYEWGREKKRSGSFLIGTSPEFDFALYTICFLSRRGGGNKCAFEINGCPMWVTSHSLEQNGKTFVGSVFPSAGRLNHKCRVSNQGIEN